MKKIAALLIFTFCATITFAQSKDEKKLAENVETLRLTLIDPIESELSKMVSDQLSYGHSSGLIENKQEFVLAIASGKFDFKTLVLSDQTIAISGKTAIVRHKMNGEIVSNGVASTLKLMVLNVWRKENGQWKLYARQAAKLI